MSLVDRPLSVQRISPGRKAARRIIGLLVLCTLAPVAFLTGKEGSALPPARSARVSLAGLDLSSIDGARDARERIREAARELCARNLGDSSLELCVAEVTAAAQRQITARTAKVSLADLDLNTPQGVRAARDRLLGAARRACEHLQTGDGLASHQYSACVDETCEHALRQADLLRRMSADFWARTADRACGHPALPATAARARPAPIEPGTAICKQCTGRTCPAACTRTAE
jgi:UrcA family protein